MKLTTQRQTVQGGKWSKRAHQIVGAPFKRLSGRANWARTAHPSKHLHTAMGALRGARGRGVRRKWGAPPLYKSGALPAWPETAKENQPMTLNPFDTMFTPRPTWFNDARQPHGSMARYATGCRCPTCSRAKVEYQAGYKTRRGVA